MQIINSVRKIIVEVIYMEILLNFSWANPNVKSVISYLIA